MSLGERNNLIKLERGGDRTPHAADQRPAILPGEITKIGGDGTNGGGSKKSTRTSPERDFRIDFFRGLALILIFIDHVPENFLSYFTLRTFAYSDAAEVFYFMSGYVAAMVYGRTLLRGGFMACSRQVYKRVWTLYVAHIMLFVLFIAEVSTSVYKSGNLTYDTDLRVDDFLAQPDIAIIKALTLQFQPVYLDILPLYIVFLAFLPFALVAIRRNIWIMLVPSVILYGAVQIWGFDLPSYPQGHTWYFNPFAWQLIFLIGASCGHPSSAERLVALKSPWLLWGAILIAGTCLVTSATTLIHSLWPAFPPILAVPPMADKTTLAPIRLINFLCIALLAGRFIPMRSDFWTGRLAWPIVRCGQFSLYVFCFTILLALMGRFVLQEVSASFGMQLLVNIVGIIAMMILSTFLAWYRNDGTVPLPPTSSGHKHAEPSS
ncbi:MAG TPA: OpgC domain-containing protein [Stellaceae bacterium]|jgi:hypothetical protein|nr:OpgC domain-containing protein [Stellaceae bacterium]